MEDREIVELYFHRSENAIVETKTKYEKYCYHIAYNILYNNEDVEECLNDMYMKVWNAIPPFRPSNLATYLGKVTRNLSLNVHEKKYRKKRGEGQMEVVYDELEEILSGKGNPEEKVQLEFVTTCINQYLQSIPQMNRMIFVGRYWYFDSIEEIAKHLGITKGKTKTILFRTRRKLREYLEKEGILI